MMAKHHYQPWQVWIFFAVTYGFSWLFWIPNALIAHGVSLPSPLVNLLSGPFNPAAFGPTVAAFALTWGRDGWRGALSLLRKGIDFHFGWRWLGIILIAPLIIFSGSIIVATLISGRSLDRSVMSDPLFALIAFFVILLTSGPLQEEFGWRGYALPRLQARYGDKIASLIVGGAWWLWHAPAVFIPGRFMTNNVLTFGALAIVIILTSFLFTWVYNHTNGSILACLLLHTAMNWSIWVVIPSMQIDLVTIGCMIIALAIVVWLIGRRPARFIPLPVTR
ncbi:CPBP family intramembrane glutamic endopeptidase [Chloroflexus sp.]|uniref:CPBP family intramembrane glutamic endopeptidase n=1 Tax=Chloroflexus sp. TaxID=1904827 RepID=UPI00298F2900|nr:CPBP family intramembrane glutamic endopeptidase [Chloroflexus sp.]MDW8405224.1 CPBP family intramembrane glutamic endopeptidase [Chloroflexus sp.]